MANILEQLVNNLRQAVSSNKSKSVLGVDISSSAIKIIQIRNQKGKAILETYGELALGPYAGLGVGQATNLPPEKIAEALKDLMKEANVTASDCGISIPLSSSLITTIKLPAVSETELRTMIPIEARKYIPVPISEVSLDWHIIPNDDGTTNTSLDKKSSIDVLVVAIHNQTLARFNEIIKGAGLASSFLEIEVFSTVRAVLDRGIAPVMILDVGAATTKIYIVEHGILRKSHIINKGSQNVTIGLSKSLNISVAEAETMKRKFGIATSPDDGQNVGVTNSLVIQSILSEAMRVMLTYQREHNKNIGKVFLVGGGTSTEGIFDLAQKTFETEVIMADPFSKLETPAFLENVLKAVGPGFAVAIGVALRKIQEL